MSWDDHPTCRALSVTHSGTLTLIHSGAHRLIHRSAVLLHHRLALLPVDGGAHLGVHKAAFIMALRLIETSEVKENTPHSPSPSTLTCCPPCPQEQPWPADSPHQEKQQEGQAQVGHTPGSQHRRRTPGQSKFYAPAKSFCMSHSQYVRQTVTKRKNEPLDQLQLVGLWQK